MNGTPDKIICSKCQKHLDVSALNAFAEFKCPSCGVRLKVPFIFDRYYLMDLCGIGGMSRVYRAFDPVMNVNVAIKITDENAFESDSVGERFTREAALVAKINHPGIVKVYRGGIYMNQPYLVMEFMKKGTLEVLQRTFMLPPVEKILSWLSVIADGLYAASQLGIVHHDVKPANIIVTPCDDMHLIDYDAAWLPGFTLADVEEVGTPAFSHPHCGVGFFDKRVDDYAIALVSVMLAALAYKRERFEPYIKNDGSLFVPKDVLDGSDELMNVALSLFERRGDMAHHHIARMLYQSDGCIDGLDDALSEALRR